MTETSQNKAGATRATIALKHLQHALKVIAPAVPSGNVVPMLQSFRLEQTSDGLAVSATDLTVAIRALIPESTSLSQPLRIPTHPFLAWAKLLEAEGVEISATTARVSIRSGPAKAAFPRITGDAAIETKFESQGAKITLEQGLLRRLLKFAMIAVGDDSRFTLNGVFLMADGEYLTSVSTDGHRLVLCKVPCSASIDKDGGFSSKDGLLFPERMLKSILPVLADDDSAIHLQEDNPFLLASIAAEIPVIVTCLKINGAFPNYKAVIPATPGTRIEVDAAALLAAFHRCVLMGSQDTRAIALTFSQGEITIQSSDPQAGESTETVETTGGPDTPVKIGVNGSYMIQALKLLSGSVAMFLPPTPTAPLTLRAEIGYGETFDYFVMPLRLG